MRDLLTGEWIKAKTKREREFSLFQSRKNMLQYFKDHPEDIEIVSIDLIKNRKILKELTYAPSLVEQRSCILPTVTLLKKNKIDYNKICKELGLIERFNYNDQLTFDSKDLSYLIDTREQSPLNLPNSKIMTLNFGDYVERSNPNIVIERKSLNDFVSTISKGYERLQDELIRAAENDVYVIMLVETNLTSSLSFNYLPQMKWSKATPEFIFSRTRELLQKNINFQVAFCDGRADMVRVIDRIYNYKGDVKKIDIEWALENKLL